MPAHIVSEYNRDQWKSFKAVQEACAKLSFEELERLKRLINPYLLFRKDLDGFHRRYSESFCQETCFDSRLSACCGFESIFTFFADQVIAFIHSSGEQRAALFHVLEQPNDSKRCVYVGEKGCLWQVRPVSCAMFFCDQAKKTVFDRHPEAEGIWKRLQDQEKEFTWPVKPVLFDELEAYFLSAGVRSPHMYFHQSAGLLRLKSRAQSKPLTKTSTKTSIS